MTKFPFWAPVNPLATPHFPFGAGGEFVHSGYPTPTRATALARRPNVVDDGGRTHRSAPGVQSIFLTGTARGDPGPGPSAFRYQRQRILLVHRR